MKKHAQFPAIPEFVARVASPKIHHDPSSTWLYRSNFLSVEGPTDCDGCHPQLVDLLELLGGRQILRGLRQLAGLGKLFSRHSLFIRQSLYLFLSIFLTLSRGRFKVLLHDCHFLMMLIFSSLCLIRQNRFLILQAMRLWSRLVPEFIVPFDVLPAPHLGWHSCL